MEQINPVFYQHMHTASRGYLLQILARNVIRTGSDIDLVKLQVNSSLVRSVDQPVHPLFLKPFNNLVYNRLYSMLLNVVSMRYAEGHRISHMRILK